MKVIVHNQRDLFLKQVPLSTMNFCFLLELILLNFVRLHISFLWRYDAEIKCDSYNLMHYLHPFLLYRCSILLLYLVSSPIEFFRLPLHYYDASDQEPKVFKDFVDFITIQSMLFLIKIHVQKTIPVRFKI